MAGTVWPYIVAFGSVAGLAHLIMLLVLLFRSKKDRSSILTAVYLGLALLWAAVTTLAELEPAFTSVFTRAGSQLIPVLATGMIVCQVLIACVFLELAGFYGFAAAGGTWSAAMLIVAVYLVYRPNPAVPLYNVAISGWSLLALVLIGMTVVARQRSRLALQRNRVLYWLLAFVPLIGGQALTLVPENPLREIGPLLHVLGAAALLRGTLSIWLPNVKAMLRSSIRFLVLALITAAFLAAIVLAADSPLAARFTVFLSRPGLIALLAGVAALAYIVLYARLQRLVDRLFENVGFDPTQALRDYSQTIGALLSSDQLATVATGTVTEMLGTRRGALLLTTETERGGLQLRPVPGIGDIDPSPLDLEPISPILARLRSSAEPLFQYELERHSVLREAASREREWLRRLDMEVYLPIFTQDELVGLLALGSQRGEEPYGTREIEFLMTLAHQTSVALQNARLFEGLQSLNEHITQLNENLRTAYERLERMDRAKNDFLTIASHELRTPLTQIRGYVDVLEDLADSGTLTHDQVRRIANNIAKPAKRLENIISAILDASRIDAEGLDLRFTPTTLALSMRLAIEQWQEPVEERNIELNVIGMDEIPPIHADMERLCQAFSNLLSNAIKFTPDGGKVTIEARPLDDEHYQVTVADTGIGISRADQELIFEKFYRVGSVSLHSTGDYKFKGAGPGLGLPITRGVIEGHGGCIWVESPGYDERRLPGSVFYVVLPYHAHRGQCRWKSARETQRMEVMPTPARDETEELSLI